MKTLTRPWTVPGLEPGTTEIQDPELREVFVEAFRNWETADQEEADE